MLKPNSIQTYQQEAITLFVSNDIIPFQLTRFTLVHNQSSDVCFTPTCTVDISYMPFMSRCWCFTGVYLIRDVIWINVAEYINSQINASVYDVIT